MDPLVPEPPDTGENGKKLKRDEEKARPKNMRASLQVLAIRIFKMGLQSKFIFLFSSGRTYCDMV